jgi:hypothetical protein
MNPIREYFEAREKAFGENIFTRFMLTAGREYPFTPGSFAGARGTPKECYSNAAHLAIWNSRLTYVEGLVHTIMPIEHAWCIDEDGTVVDPTLDLTGRVGEIHAYWGVPFRTDYLKRALRANGVYGLLDIFYSGKSAPKLFELGLEAGQQWLMDQPDALLFKRKRRKVKRAA